MRARLLLLAPLVALAACQTTAPAPAPTTASTSPPVPKPAKLNQTIAQLAGNDLSKACSVFDTAVGYWKDASTIVGFFAPTWVPIANAAILGGNAICNAPSSSLSADLANLNKFWAQIQSLTKTTF